MENLNSQQYENVLKYMEQHPEANFNTATQIMALHSYDINKFRQNHHQAHYEQVHNYLDVPVNQEFNNGDFDEQQMNKMRKFLIKNIQGKNNSRRVIRRSKQCVSKLCLSITEKILPELIKRKIIRSRFYKLYQDNCVIALNNKSFMEARIKAKQKDKYLVVIISGEQKNAHITDFLRNKRLLNQIMDDFEIVGITEGEANLDSALQRQRASSIIFARENQIQQINIIQRFIDGQIRQINSERIHLILNNLKQAYNTEIQKMKRASRILENISSISSNRNIQYQYQQEQEQEDEGQLYLKNRRERTIIKKQNAEYEKMKLQKEQQRQLQEIMKRQLQEKKQERSVRKMSIPEQPQDQNNQNIILFQFRCPSGECVTRKFEKNQRCQLLFSWVDLNEDIEFEDGQLDQEGSRKFDLLYSYPPQSLKQNLKMPISQVFEENMAKIVIKEL